jgi:Zn-dependent M28 family amino/carboxypeptidase
MQKYLASLCLLALLSGCSTSDRPSDTDDGLATFSADSLKKHVAVLASDDFLGRMPFTEGETKTIAYLQQQFQALGLEPGNGDSYLQEVPMVNIQATAAPAMQVVAQQGSFSLKAFDDYVIWTDRTEASQRLDNSELVFAGYGVVAPEYNWNDYEGLDVKGKVVLVMVNDPGFWAGDTTLFKGKEMTYYGRWTYKFEEAARQGAKGCLIIHRTEAAGYPFGVQQNNFNTSRLQLDNRGKNIPNCDVIGWVPETVAMRLMQAAGQQGTDLLARADRPGFRAVPLGVKLSTSLSVKTTYNKTHNVLAKLTGTQRPDEVIIYSAHWDHLGIGTPDATGDSIYNGALDNASGTAGLLELARAFKSLKTQPERTIVFLAVTAEEQGLWGSAYYAQNPVFPANKTVANINMDGLNRFEATKDMVLVGEGQSELEEYVREIMEKDGGYISVETHPEAGYYYRSDHFNFAKVGIPALYLESGVDVVGKGKAHGEKLQNEYTEKNYHQPSDEYDPATWTMQGAVSELKLLFRVGKRLAFETTWPQWKEGSEFKALREAQQ